MPYFSRLTDIVTCNLTRLLEESDDPQATLREIIAEMELGLSGARRSAATAQASVERLQGEVEDNAHRVDQWTGRAREALSRQDENAARMALVRKREAEALLEGLKEELAAAEETRGHLQTTMRALEARLAEARRREQELQAGISPDTADTTASPDDADSALAADIEDELAALRKELGQS